MKLKKLYYLEWIDAYQDSGGGWKTLEDIDEWLEKWGDFVIKQCGWIIKETDKFIVLASEKHPTVDDSEEQYSLIQKIPKTWIKKKLILNKE
jgi:UV DNA damage repair endonuclease